MQPRGDVLSGIDLPQSTLGPLLILKTLKLESHHCWGISEGNRQVSREVLQVQQGSLYPALHRQEHRGWLQATWGMSDNNRRAKFCDLTPAGRRQLEDASASWQKVSAAVRSSLTPASRRRCSSETCSIEDVRYSSAGSWKTISMRSCIHSWTD